MHYIDIQSWSRREHFKFFSTFDHPHFSMSVNVDLANFYPAVKQRGISFTVAIVFVISRSANAIPEFRYRIRDGQVIEHDVVHPSTTILGEDDAFGFCAMEYSANFTEFATRAAQEINRVKEHPTLEQESDRDDFLFMTPIPWVSFTSFMHPIHLQPPDSIPRFAWGKIFEEGNSLKMPLGVQVHHALMDGLHVARYYAHVQDLLDDPNFLVEYNRLPVDYSHRT